MKIDFREVSQNSVDVLHNIVYNNSRRTGARVTPYKEIPISRLGAKVTPYKKKSQTMSLYTQYGGFSSTSKIYWQNAITADDKMRRRDCLDSKKALRRRLKSLWIFIGNKQW